MTETLSIHQARKMVLLSQRVPPVKPRGAPEAATLSAIENLGYIQIDTISVVQRAHHHILWSRNPNYHSRQLDPLLAGKQVFEYWSHAAAYLPFSDYRFSLVRKQALKDGSQNHWFTRDEKMIKLVQKRIADEGPLMARDFEHKGKKVGEWQSKPAKRALEILFMQGDLMVPTRKNFHKVYDLTERVVPAGTDTRLPTPEEYARHLIFRYLQANGLGQAQEIVYLRKGIKPMVTATLAEMVLSGELIQLQVGDALYYALPDSLELLHNRLNRQTLKILSPFDNLLIQRKRMQALFGFDYLIECYVPAAKRQYGYFSLPVLWDGRLVARMDCKAERKKSLLHIHHLVLESTVSKTESFIKALGKELRAFLTFNQCKQIRIHRIRPAHLKPVLQRELRDLTE